MLKGSYKWKAFRKFPYKRKSGGSQLSETSDYDTSLILNEEEREVAWKHARLG